MCRVARADERAAARRRRGPRRGLRLGRRRHRQDLGARRALRPRRLRRGPRRRVGARHHLHAQGGRRAARPHPRRARSSAGGPTSPASSTGPGSRPSTASAAGCCARIRSRSGSTRASTSSTRSTAPFSAARRSTARSRRSAPRATPSGSRLLATYGSKRLRKMLTGVYETLRSAGRAARRSSWASPADLDGRLSDLREAAQCLLDDTGATENHVAAAQAALDLPSLPDTLIDLAALRTRGARAATFEEARKNVEQAALELVATRDKALLQELLDLFAAEYQAGKERESALDFEDLQLLARDLLVGDARVREAEQLRFRSIMVDEFQDTNALQCELIDLLGGRAREGDVLRRRRVPVDLRVPACGRRRLPRAPGSGRAALLADRELPLAARGARRGQPRLRRGVRRRLPAARRVGRVPRPRVRAPGRAARHRQGVLPRVRRALAPGRGPRDRAPRARARRRGRGDAGRDRAPVRRRNRRGAGTRRSSARSGLPDLPGDRPALLRPAAGRRPAHVPAAAAQPLRRRGARPPCSPRRSSASRTTASC